MAGITKEELLDFVDALDAQQDICPDRTMTEFISKYIGVINWLREAAERPDKKRGRPRRDGHAAANGGTA